MRIGVPKEIKNEENRIGLIPASVRELVAHGHEVLVETHGGYGIGFDDDDYRKAGARIAAGATDKILGQIMKVSAAALDRALADTPDLRADRVERARELIRDVSYPPEETIQRIASLLATNLGKEPGDA